MRIRTGVIAVAIALASLTACGSEDDARQSTSAQPNQSGVAVENSSMQFNPCALVNNIDASHAMGDSFTSLETENPPVTGLFSERNCVYKGSSGRSVVIQTMLDDQPGGTAWKDSITAAKSNDGGNSFYEPFPGIGDEAFFGPAGTVVVRRGYLVVTISIPSNTLDAKQPLSELAHTAMSRVA